MFMYTLNYMYNGVLLFEDNGIRDKFLPKKASIANMYT